MCYSCRDNVVVLQFIGSLRSRNDGSVDVRFGRNVVPKALPNLSVRCEGIGVMHERSRCERSSCVQELDMVKIGNRNCSKKDRGSIQRERSTTISQPGLLCTGNPFYDHNLCMPNTRSIATHHGSGNTSSGLLAGVLVEDARAY